jgi:hypothetical protein
VLLSLVLTYYAAREHVVGLLSLAITSVGVPVSMCLFSATTEHVPKFCLDFAHLLVPMALFNQNAP